MVTNEYLRGVKCNELLPMPGKLWQRNYYEHIIRNEEELNRFREYIQGNPMQWEMDEENLERNAGKEKGLTLIGYDVLSLCRMCKHGGNKWFGHKYN